MARVAYLQADVHRSGAPPELQLRDDAPSSRRTVARGLADIVVPVQLLYVGQDVFVPTGHGEGWLSTFRASRPGCSTMMVTPRW